MNIAVVLTFVKPEAAVDEVVTVYVPPCCVPVDPDVSKSIAGCKKVSFTSVQFIACICPDEL